MNQARRTTLFLTALALILGIAFSGSCIALAFSVRGLRGDLEKDVDVLLVIDDLRDVMMELDRIVLAAAPGPPGETAPRWRASLGKGWSLVEGLGDQSTLPAAARTSMDLVSSALASVDEAGRALSASPAGDATGRLRSVYVEAHQDAHATFSEAVTAIRGETAEISAVLGGRWRALYVLAFLSAATVVVLVLLLMRARLDAVRHKDAERDLRHSEERFRSVLAAAPDVILVLDSVGRYRNVFTAEADLLVSPAEDLLGRTIHEVLPEGAARQVQDVIDRAIKTQELQCLEYPLTINGRQKWFSARVAPFGSADDPCVLWFARDVTDRREAEQGLRESEARLRQLTENLDEVVWLSSWPDRSVIYVSHAYESIWGRTCQSLYEDPESWQEGVHPEDRARVLESFERDARLGPYEVEFRVVRDDGTERWVRVRVCPIRDADGNVHRIAGVTQDITAHKRAEDALREREELFRSVIGMANDGVVVADHRGVITLWNEAAAAIFGHTAEEAVGRPLTLIVPRRFHEQHKAGLRRAVSGSGGRLMGQTVELTGLREDGSEFPMELSLTSWQGPQGVFFTGLVRDITERKRAEEVLRESEARFRQLAENIDEVVSLAPPMGRGIDYVSPAYETIWGRTCQSLYDDPASWQELIHPDDRDRVLEAFEADAPRGVYDQQYRIVRDDGTIRWVRDRTFPVRDAEGATHRIAGLTQDITEAKLAEQALRASEERFRSAFDETAVGMVLTDLDGRFVRVNPAFCGMVGRCADELSRLTFLDITHPDDVATSGENVHRLIAGETRSFSLEKRYLRPDGTVVWALTSVALVTGEDGRPVNIVAETQDISDRKATEQRLRESEGRFRSIFEHAGAGMATVTPEGRFLQVNPEFSRYLGYDEQELLGLSVAEVTHPDDRERIAALMEEVRRGERNVIDVVKRCVRKDRRTVWCHVTSAWLHDDGGRSQYGVALIQDITEAKEADEALREAKADLERRVTERTADLLDANRQLTQEIAVRRRAEMIQRGHNRVLERLAAGAPLEEVLTVLVEASEAVFPDMICSVLLLDEDKTHLLHGAAPSLPDFYNEAIDGLEIGPGVGSCGTAAATGQRVVIEDVMTHPYWAPFRELATRAELGASWSEPILSSDGEILGTFAIYYREPRAPDDASLELITASAYLAGIAIERRQAEAKLRDSEARLRMQERLASLGTLTAGLGHDMNNILFPFRLRLGALDWEHLPPEQRELVEAARDMTDNLQQLCNGLRLFAADPEDQDGAAGVTSLAAWWERVEPLLSKMLPDKVELTTRFPSRLPLVAVAPHQLTQAVMNLVINASEAMPAGGRVRIRARRHGRAPRILLSVTDDGAGMSDEVRRRAFDPFFTTKKRSLSTGLGLSLVLGLVRRSGGSVSLESAPGKGTTVILTLPVAGGTPAAAPALNGGREQAVVSLTDPRTAAWIADLLETAGYEVAVAGDGDPGDRQLWVTESTAASLERARAFSAAGADRRIIALGPSTDEWADLGAVAVEDVNNLEAIKSAVCEVTPVLP